MSNLVGNPKDRYKSHDAAYMKQTKSLIVSAHLAIQIYKKVINNMNIIQQDNIAQKNQQIPSRINYENHEQNEPGAIIYHSFT